MTKTYTTPFNAAKNKSSNAPVTLLRIDWNAINGSPALTIRLCDRGTTAYSAAGASWLPVVADWGDLLRNIDETMLATNSDADLRLSVVNSPIDWGDAFARTFSELWRIYPPEAAVAARVYQWFDGESLDGGDLVEIFTGHINPLGYDEHVAEVELVALSGALGDRVIGGVTSLADYPNAPSSSIGTPKPIVIGAVEDALGRLMRTAAETELTDSALPGAGTIHVKDASLFPANGLIEIGSDVITYSGKTATSFTGCVSVGDTLNSSGIAQAHFSGAKAALSISDYRYLFSDPAYPIKSISNVKIAGQKADMADYSIILAAGEVVFPKRPRILISTGTEFATVNFDAVGAGNSALTAANASDSAAVTSNATIRQTARSLQLKQTKSISDRGAIKKVYVAVEHYEEEKLPNDSVQVTIPSIGTIGVLARPNSNDKITVAGTTNVGHGHVETIGGIVDIAHMQGNSIAATTNIAHPHIENINATITDPTHYHQVSTNGSQTLDQVTPTPLGTFNLGGGGQAYFSFGSYSGTTLSAEYVISFTLSGYNTTVNGGTIFLNGIPIATVSFPNGISSPPVITIANLVTIQGAQGSTAILYSTGFTSVNVTVASLARKLFFTAAATSLPITTGAAVTKSGTIAPLGTNNVGGAMVGGVNSVPPGTDSTLERTGALAPVVLSPPLGNITQEKSSRAVIEYFDITSHVTGWAWFTNQEIHVDYVGSADGRSAYIVHASFEVEYGVAQYENTDLITADVEGVVDASGAIAGTPGALITRPDHVFMWSLFTPPLGLTSGDIDAASFAAAGSAFAAAIPGGYKLAGLINTQTTFKALWAAWEKEARCYLYWTNTGKAKLLYRILNDLGGVVSAKAITAAMIKADVATGKSGIKARRTIAANIINSIDMKYSRDWASSGYRNALNISRVSSVGTYGLKQRPDLFSFDWTRSEGQAESLAEFYLYEFASPMTIIEVEVFLDNLEIEKGDIVDITHSLDNMAGAKGLVLEANQHIGSGVGGKMDAMTLLVRMFQINFLYDTEIETVAGTDSIPSFSMAMVIAENITAIEAFPWALAMPLVDTVTADETLTEIIEVIFLEAITAVEAFPWSLTMSLSENVAAFESESFDNAGFGYGVGGYGNSPYGGDTSLSDLYYQPQETVTADDLVSNIATGIAGESTTASDGDVAIVFADTITASDLALITSVGGYANDLYGAQGYGGYLRVA